ncbi:MAG: nuclear transport factor 2 family protein [Arenicellaceae bacterium]|nr:nuclear transport factor 2 family protein [Arenicellaceae bacterium]
MKIFQKLALVISAQAMLAMNVIATDLSAAEESQIKAEIKELADAYAINRDNNDAVAYANTFAKDGTLILYGNSYSGRETIQTRIDESDSSGVGMHVMSTSVIEVIDSEHATGVHYATIYGGTKADSHEAGDIIPLANFRVMGKYHDKYVLTDEGWKFSERRLEPIFSGPE